jgi:RHS repeat-associated protein
VSYNSRLQIQNYTDQSNNNSATPLFNAALTWVDANNHNNGNLQGATYTYSGSGFSSPATFSDTFTYDNVNRLSSATDKQGNNTEWSQNYSFDPYGNMIVSSYAGIAPPGNTPGVNTLFSNNRIVGGTYDAAGNQTLVNGNTLTYDAEGREVTNVSNAAETYAYDGNSRRVGKSNSASATTFVYDALGQLAMEVSSVATVPACWTCYLSDDHLGGTRLVTDGSGNVVARHDYLPFGYEIQASDNAGRGIQFGAYDNVNQKFTGKERDSESGLDYFGARYYGSALGRSTSADPITVTPARAADPQQLNLYAYGRNNPLKYVDPTGMIIDTDDLSDKDKKIWQKVVDLANKQDDDGNYVNPALHAAYAALDSDSRVFKIEDNPGLGSGTAGQFTITKFNGPNDFSEARVDLNFKVIKGISSTTTGDFDPSFQKYSGLLGSGGFIPRLAETFGHEANHGIFAQLDPSLGTAIQRILNNRDTAMQALPAKGRYPLPPDVMQKVQEAQKALVPTEKFAQQAEKIINGELKASQVK